VAVRLALGGRYLPRARGPKGIVKDTPFQPDSVFLAGVKAHEEGKHPQDCPFGHFSGKTDRWLAGWEWRDTGLRTGAIERPKPVAIPAPEPTPAQP
jgi:hypothetical protein